MADSKLTESSEKSEKSDTQRVKNENKNKTHTDLKQSTLLHKNVDNASTNESTDNSDNNSSINRHDINSKSKKSILILGDSMLTHLQAYMLTHL